jgi:hypothetical protein
MTDIRARAEELGTVGLMRLGMLGLAIGAVIVTAAELAFLTHWDGTLQLLPWVALVAVSVGILLIIVRRGRAVAWTARALGAVALVLGGVGVLVHVISNYDAGVLDYHYTDTWPTMGELGRWWLAATGGVGPTPPLAPASLAFAALLLLMATIGILAPAGVTEAAAVTAGWTDAEDGPTGSAG